MLEYPRTCKHCNIEFVAHRKDNIFCNRKCKTLYLNARKLAENGVLYDKKCDQCGVDYQSYKPGQRFCSSGCDIENKKYIKKLYAPIKCIGCQVEFIPKSKIIKRCEKCVVGVKRNIKIDGIHSIICGICGVKFNTDYKHAKYCGKECSNTATALKHNDRLRSIKQQFLGNDVVCSICNKIYDQACLAFHHLRDKRFHLTKTNFFRISTTELLQELQKTVKVCHNCHAKLHHQEHLDNPKEIKRDSVYKNTIREKRKQTLIDMHGRKCKCCGLESELSCVYSFDHIGEKNFLLCKSTLGYKKWEDILKENENCELLCMNCHFLKNKLPANLRKVPILELIDRGLLNKPAV